jgi:hypothetical protein
VAVSCGIDYLARMLPRMALILGWAAGSEGVDFVFSINRQVVF